MRIPAFMLPQKCTIEAFLGNTAYGPKYDVPKEESCRFEPKNQLVRDREGNEVASNARVFFFPEANVTPESKVTFNQKDYTVIDAAPQTGPFGETHHIEAVLR